MMMLLFIIPATLNSLAAKPQLKYLMICPIQPDPDPGLGPSPDLAMAALFRRRPQ